jgi:hypothetical protein
MTDTTLKFLPGTCYITAFVIKTSTDGPGGEPLQFTRARRSGGGLGPEYAAYVFVFLGNIVICR